MRLTICVTPNASVDRVDGCDTDGTGRRYLKVRVRAIPEKGKANKAVENLLSKAPKLPQSAVHVVTGQTTRIKTVRVDCTDGTVAAQLIGEWMAHDG